MVNKLLHKLLKSEFMHFFISVLVKAVLEGIKCSCFNFVNCKSFPVASKIFPKRVNKGTLFYQGFV